MKAHPFFVITATIGSYSDRRWWVVCVALEDRHARDVQQMLTREAEEFNRRRVPIDAEHTRRYHEIHGLRSPSWPDSSTYRRTEDLSPEERAHQALYHEADDVEKRALAALKIGMTDKKFPYSRHSTELPEYEIVSTFDDPSEGEPHNALDDDR